MYLCSHYIRVSRFFPFYSLGKLGCERLCREISAKKGNPDLLETLVQGVHLKGPLPDLRIVNQELGQLQVLGDRNIELDTAAIEISRDHQLTEFLVERTQVADKAAGNGAIP